MQLVCDDCSGDLSHGILQLLRRVGRPTFKIVCARSALALVGEYVLRESYSEENPNQPAWESGEISPMTTPVHTFKEDFKVLLFLALMFTGTMRLLLRRPPVPEVTAQVTAHHLHHSPLCTRMVSLDGERIEPQCWGAHVSFAYPTEEGDTRNCTITSAVARHHTKTEAQCILLESFSMTSSHAVYPQPNGDCLLTSPSTFSFVDVVFGAAAMLCGSVFLAGLVDTSMRLWKQYGASLKAWWQQGSGGGGGGGGGGGEGDDGQEAWLNFGADKKTDLPLVASASLP